MSGTIQLLPEFEPIGGTNNTPGATPGSPERIVGPVVTGQLTDPSLPNPRTVSNVVSGSAPNGGPGDPVNSDMLYVWGQFTDHDMDKAAVGRTDISIPVPPGDPFLPDGTVIPLSAAGPTAINTVTAILDLSQVYGSDAATAASLRNADGTLVTSFGNTVPIVGGQFVSGDVRVGENPELSAITSLFVREHNYWVGQLSAQHPDWTGDQLYNMARAICTAEEQNIIYTEYLPALIGKSTPTFTGYNPNLSPQESELFTTGAFRIGHSQISGTQAGIDNAGNQTFAQSLAQAFFDTPAEVIANGVNDLLRNLGNDTGQKTDVYAIDDLRNFLVAPPDNIDLIAIDIQRERDLGLGTLNQTRVALGLKAYTSFDQLTNDPVVAANLQRVYGSIDKVDLFIGGLAETARNGGVAGQTFSAIIGDQFNRLANGDRFFWQNEAFDPATKAMIAATTLGNIIERNTGTAVMQQNVFLAAQRHLSSVAAEDPTAAQLVIGVDDNGATIAGGPADDTIVAGLGTNQTLTGGGGRDVFVYDGSGHTDTITDFKANGPQTDQIRFHDVLASTTVSVQELTGGSCRLTFDGNTITLDHVAGHSLSTANFILSPGQVATLDFAKGVAHS